MAQHMTTLANFTFRELCIFNSTCKTARRYFRTGPHRNGRAQIFLSESNGRTLTYNVHMLDPLNTYIGYFHEIVQMRRINTDIWYTVDTSQKLCDMARPEQTFKVYSRAGFLLDQMITKMDKMLINMDQLIATHCQTVNTGKTLGS